MIDQSLWDTAVEFGEYLQRENQRFCFIGGIVVQRWGEPRVTGDVDATVLVPFGQEAAFASRILEQYRSRIDDPVQFATQARILLLQDARFNRIDLDW